MGLASKSKGLLNRVYIYNGNLLLETLLRNGLILTSALISPLLSTCLLGLEIFKLSQIN